MSGFGYQVRKSLDRVGFEADKKMRIARVKGEEARLKKRADEVTQAIGNEVVKLDEQGVSIHPSLQEMIAEVRALHLAIASKHEEQSVIAAEQWVAPSEPAQSAEAAGTSPSSKADARPEDASQVLCPTCGSPLRPGAQFCAHCGLKVMP